MNIEIANIQQIYQLNEDEIQLIIKKILNDKKKDAELSIVFVDDEKIKELNNDYLGEDAPTDVLSFPLDDFDGKSNEKICGEIIISVETALHTAEKMNSVVESEIYLYVVHGLLHLIGYDDKTGKLADIMHGEEKRILSDLGFEVNFNT